MERNKSRGFRRSAAGALAGAFAGVLALSGPGHAQTPGSIDWGAQGWTDEQAVPTSAAASSGGATVTLTWSTVTDGGSFVAAGGADFVSYEADSASGVSRFLQLGFDNSDEDPDDQIIVNLAFSTGVTDLQFTLIDIDEGDFDDFVEVYYATTGGLINARTGSFATLGGNAVTTDNENFGDGWEGRAIAGASETIGNIAFNFGALEVTAIQIRYFSGNDVSGNANPGLQLSGLSSLTYNVPTPTADLSLAKTVSNATPAVGANVTYTLTLSNAGPQTATGVSVSDVLPSGVSYVSDTGGGAYNSGTGLWTPGSIVSGGSTSLSITATALGSGDYANIAEVIAAGQFDPDSTPNNGSSAPGEDDIAVVTITPGGTSGTPPTLTCGASADRLDWNANAWPSNSTSQSYTAGGQSLDFAFTGDTGFFIDVGPGLTPVTSSLLTGGGSATEQNLLVAANWPSNTSTITLTANIGTAGVGVSALQFAIYDVDIGAGNTFVDRLQIVGYLNGALVAPVLTTSSANTASGFVATGTAEAASDSATGTVTVTFTSAVDQVVIVYGNTTSASADPNQQGVGFADFVFCQPLSAELDATKTVAVFGGGYAIPGADVVYTITATNSGDGPVDSGTVFIVDTLSSDIEFYNGDIDDAGPETGAVAFSQSGAGLTFTIGTDVAFSSSVTRPALFSACSYTPSAGYDPNVRHVCFNPKGAFLAGSPDPSFSVSFRARIK